MIGERLAPSAADPLAWDVLSEVDAVYVTAGDVEALRLARRARKVVATARILPTLRAAGIVLDALVGSSRDPAERYATGDLDPPPRLIVRTAGGAGGSYELADGRTGEYPAAPLPGPVVDAYGCGDAFAAGLTYALGADLEPEAALRFAARCGAAALTGRGPHGGQLTRAQLEQRDA